MTVAALFVDAAGIYPEILGGHRVWCGREDFTDPRDDDARYYADNDPVVAHPPCQLWCNMAAVNWKRYGRQRPAWYPGGDDGGCFASALANVRRCGGVLEHPAGSHAWGAHGLVKPVSAGWTGVQGFWRDRSDPVIRYSVCEVWQSAYGHGARKRTWLIYCGKRPPFELDWTRAPGTHQIGWFDRAKPTLSKRAASATPRAFAVELIRLAEWSRG